MHSKDGGRFIDIKIPKGDGLLIKILKNDAGNGMEKVACPLFSYAATGLFVHFEGMFEEREIFPQPGAADDWLMPPLVLSVSPTRGDL